MKLGESDNLSFCVPDVGRFVKFGVARFIWVHVRSLPNLFRGGWLAMAFGHEVLGLLLVDHLPSI